MTRISDPVYCQIRIQGSVPRTKEHLKILLHEYFYILFKAFFSVFMHLVSDVLCKLWSPGSGPNFTGPGLVFWILNINAKIQATIP